MAPFTTSVLNFQKTVDIDAPSSGILLLVRRKSAMDLIKITDLTSQLNLSSRSLRYYEQVGLIKSTRPKFEKYRYFDAENVERLKQIIVLRKMQIPIKDIIRIYESENMRTVVEVFVDHINAINEETNALVELKRIVSDFLQTMIQNGITKISAIPLLYEEMDKQLNELEERKPANFKDLLAVNKKLAKPLNLSIIDLPPMRVLTSFRKPNTKESDFSGFLRYMQLNGLSPLSSGNHRQFEFQTEAGDVLMVRVPEDFINESEYLDYTFAGGFFAAANVYLDEDLGELFRKMVHELNVSPYYQFAYCANGTSRHPTLLENLISPDDKRELVSMLVPVKKRTANPALLDKPIEVADISIEEIEAANPILWTADVPLDSITPINNPHYRVNNNGEAEYTGWISTRVLNTNKSVKLPFRVDIEFKILGLDERYGYGDSEGSIVVYRGDDPGQFGGGGFTKGFGINTWNNANQIQQAIHFYQPVFGDFFKFPERGAINAGEYNRATWIIGEKHIAFIINDEIRYCGTNFPYMTIDLSCEITKPIVIGSNGQGMKYFRSIRVSRLAEAPKNKLKTGELTMIAKQSNNLIPIIHRLITSEYGENYWFNGCARYVMEALGEYIADADLMTDDIYNCKVVDNNFGYWLFAAITGDIFTQHYAYDKYAGDALSSYMMDEEIGGNPAKFTEETFAKVGYAATFISNRDIIKNTEMHLNTLMSYIDRGVPVIAWGAVPTEIFGVFVGYEDYGKVLLYISGDNNQPERVPLDKALIGEVKGTGGWIFVGEKTENLQIADIYREAIKAIPNNLNIKTDKYCFGAEAFRAWASDIESEKLNDMTNEEFDVWAHHTNYVCVLATNGSCVHNFIKRAQAHCPDIAFLEEVSNLYKKTNNMWSELETLGGWFNVTLKALQNKENRRKITAKIREFADVADDVFRVLSAGVEKMQ